MPPGKMLIALGGLLLAAGLALNFAPWLFSWFGKLPGDIRIENKNSSIFIPLGSMLLISLLASLAANLFLRK